MSSALMQVNVFKPESLGTIEIFGTSLSTQTQALLIALQECNVKYIHHPSMPNSPEIANFSPFGKIPVLVHRPNGIYSTRDAVVLFEMTAICQYLTELLGFTKCSGSFCLMPKIEDEHSREFADSVVLRSNVLQLDTIVTSYIQTVVEDRYVKPFFALRNNGASHADIYAALTENFDNAMNALIQLEQIITKVQERLHILPETSFILGKEPTWVAVFLFPILRDFRATNPRMVLAGGSQERLPLLTNFVQAFENRASAVNTLRGSFAGSV